MNKILVVDDEPRVSAGIRNLLLASELHISHVETALNGFEAIDYLRMDTYDLVLTDIQMSRMTGIELMETIYMEQPHLPVIVISAHEKFDFAKKSLSLGARDYLVKPVEREVLLQVVGKVLREKEEIGRQSLELSKRHLGRPESLTRHELLLELVTEGTLSKQDREDLTASLGERGEAPVFVVVSVRLNLAEGGFSRKEITLQDRKLLKYAAMNLLEESLAEWRGTVLTGYGNGLVAILQLNEPEMSVPSASAMGLKTQLQLIGQKLHTNLKQFLNLEATIGISKPHPDVFSLPKLMDEANKAAEWKTIHPSNHVFYYEDRLIHENLSIVEWAARIDQFVQELKSQMAKAASMDWTSMTEPLEELGDSEELFHRYFGMLVYRLYGLLLEYGHLAGASLQRFDPGVYFRGGSQAERLKGLSAYMRETAELLRACAEERDLSIVSKITAYIRDNYRNPALKIQDIAEEVHFSTAYSSYLFKKEMKKNIWDFVTELRIDEAKQLLATTDKKRYEIAYEVGYESPEHFSRMFKRSVGVSPAEYRKDG
ncbi:response regulator [Paenibacillus sp. PL2-23]|uniref:response regulator transcription factor n=1 Tax=Paenibacillus sp. PL2-23 TaxID=2100729 RepID=UPI0030F91006